MTITISNATRERRGPPRPDFFASLKQGAKDLFEVIIEAILRARPVGRFGGQSWRIVVVPARGSFRTVRVVT